jgi:hypothetical protein
LKNHTKIYFEALGYDTSDFIPSEINGDPAVDIHHIFCKGMGGSKNKDRIENLMAVTRQQHEEYGDKPEYYVFLLTTHYNFLEAYGVDFDKKWMQEQIHKYS